MKIFELSLRYLKKYKIRLFIYVALSILCSILNLISPYINGKLVDKLLFANNVKVIIIYILVLILIVLLQLIFGYITRILFTKIQIKCGYQLNKYILDHVKRLPLNFFENKDFSYLNQKINNDSNNIIIFSIQIISDLIINILTLLCSLYFIVNINYKIIFIAIFLVIAYIFLYTFMKNIIYSKEFKLKEKQAIFFASLYRQLSNIRFLKLHSEYEIFDKSLENDVSNLYNSALESQNVNYMFLTIEKLLTLLATMLILIIGSIQVISGNLSIGIFTTLSSYFSIFLAAINYFLSLGQNYQNVLVCHTRIQEILSISPELNGKAIIENINSVILKDLSFSYRDEYIIKDFNYIFEINNIYCIIGENGIGKSTLIDIILGMHLNECEGELLYNNINIKNLNMDDLRKNLVGITAQVPFVINDTIFNNLNLYTRTIDETMVNKLSTILKLTDKNSKSNFSGGEKQKISLIRELIYTPQLIILDEPTTGLDFESKLNLIEHINSLRNNRIIIIVTHDSEILKIADEIIDLTKIKLSANLV